MGNSGIQLFWQRQMKRSSRDKNALRTLNRRVKELNKKVKHLNKQIVEMHKDHDKPGEVALSALSWYKTITNIEEGKSRRSFS